ncbi:drug/metabolite transporter (DMT)-like permease [Melghirimyces profundicolus]|uniref:Drug/metabolite transporter (DMT)-like permease n=1 Tax=Melghirimyces profundicolus TaxID=1242148 RepID=A0A2T6BS47_9BACL|nr:DMT family transporter [Melghirimyces profundicolus]PTX58866.1 drug/metabolite transporter (DMT)-like permease [Melghirimyces profundicolus]
MGLRAVYLVMTLNMLIWGLNTVALKVLVQHLAPLTMQSLRIMLAGVVLLLFLRWRKQWRRPASGEWRYLWGAILLGVVGHHSCLALGLERTTATNAALILALLPLSTTLLSALFLKDRITGQRAAGIFMGIVGVAFVVLRGSGELNGHLAGDLWVFGAMATQAASFIYIKKATDTLDAKQVTSLMFLFGPVGIFIVSLFLHPRGVADLTGAPGWIWWVFLASSVIATGLGHMLYNSAIHRLGPGQSAIFTNLTPFFAVVGSVLFLKEQIHPSQIIGFLLITAGVFLGSGAAEQRHRFRLPFLRPARRTDFESRTSGN